MFVCFVFYFRCAREAQVGDTHEDVAQTPPQELPAATAAAVEEPQAAQGLGAGAIRSLRSRLSALRGSACQWPVASQMRTRIATCLYPDRVEACPHFVPGLPHVVARSRRPSATSPTSVLRGAYDEVERHGTQGSTTACVGARNAQPSRPLPLAPLPRLRASPIASIRGRQHAKISASGTQAHAIANYFLSSSGFWTISNREGSQWRESRQSLPLRRGTLALSGAAHANS